MPPRVAWDVVGAVLGSASMRAREETGKGGDAVPLQMDRGIGTKEIGTKEDQTTTTAQKFRLRQWNQPLVWNLGVRELRANLHKIQLTLCTQLLDTLLSGTPHRGEELIHTKCHLAYKKQTDFLFFPTSAAINNQDPSLFCQLLLQVFRSEYSVPKIMYLKYFASLLATGSQFIRTAASISGSEAVAPSQDPWYTLPTGADCSDPTSRGTVLRLRQAPRATTQSMSGLESAWNVMYCTVNSRSEPSFAVTTVLMPRGADRTSLISHQVAYDSANIDDSPSYGMNSLLSCPTDQSVILPFYINKGWIVNLPDYEGPAASFTSGHTSGYAVLDSVKAVLSLKDSLGIDQNVRYALHGYSGGALATEWALELQPSYAPELRFTGAALGGVPCKVADAVSLINGKPAAALIVEALLGLSTQHPVLNTTMRAQLKHTGRYNATGFLSAVNYSLAKAATEYQNQDITEYFEDGLDWLQIPAIQGIFDTDATMGNNDVPTAPLFVYQAVRDGIAPAVNVDSLVQKYCESGARIEYTRNAATNHDTEGFVGALKAIDWLTEHFNGPLQVRSACATADTSMPLNETIRARYISEWRRQGLPAESLAKKF